MLFIAMLASLFTGKPQKQNYYLVQFQTARHEIITVRDVPAANEAKAVRQAETISGCHSWQSHRVYLQY